jgi:hypothetical protein
VDGSDIGFIAETAVEGVHMLKAKAVRLENGMVPLISQDIFILLCLAGFRRRFEK